jgi:hypothetical protein
MKRKKLNERARAMTKDEPPSTAGDSSPGGSSSSGGSTSQHHPLHAQSAKVKATATPIMRGDISGHLPQHHQQQQPQHSHPHHLQPGAGGGLSSFGLMTSPGGTVHHGTAGDVGGGFEALHHRLHRVAGGNYDNI